MTLARTFISFTITLFLALASNAANPPPGIPVPPEILLKLESGASELETAIASLTARAENDPSIRALIPDIEIYYNAVRYALVHDQFYRDKKPNEFEVAAALLETGMSRARALQKGKAPWTRQTGLVVRGYVSEVDGSVQPYGLEIPDTYDFDASETQALDIWYHGRGNTLSEIKFLHDRESSPGKFHSPKTIVLHPFGRYCNGNKFVGEVDSFEAIESVSKRYRIDSGRIAVRGFSMGGAVVWHMAAHHAGRWVAAAPGAGFAETAIYADVMNKTPPPAWYELKLHSLYDATKYAGNLFHCPTIAYSGSEDKQKQAADIMAEYMKAEGLELPHVIGPGMGHKYDEASIGIINDQVKAWAKMPLNPFPKEIRFTTYTLRYNQMLWLTVDSLDQHWKRSDIRARVIDERQIEVQTENVRALTFDLPAKRFPGSLHVLIDGQRIECPPFKTSGKHPVSFRKRNETWSLSPAPASQGLVKKHGLQGPIDDAFMSRFLFVLPTGASASPELARWVESESKDAIAQWWRQFRGEVRVKRDVDVTSEDIQECNLILWGDPSSNRLLARIHENLPLSWDKTQFAFDGKRYSTSSHTPVFVYPNPLNPERYIVINSSFTFSEFSGGSNSLQIPKLPDWAVIDLSIPRSERHPQGVVNAGFFNESWQFQNRQ